MEVVWLKEATEDLNQIGSHIAEDNPVMAYQVLVKIKTSADTLQDHPELGRPGRVAQTRELVIPGLPYILPYYIKKQQVRILAVMHTSRKWPDGFSEK